MSGDEVPELEVICSICDGSGRRVGTECKTCAGTGYETTEFGERVLELMKNRFGKLFWEYKELYES